MLLFFLNSLKMLMFISLIGRSDVIKIVVFNNFIGSFVDDLRIYMYLVSQYIKIETEILFLYLVNRI